MDNLKQLETLQHFFKNDAQQYAGFSVSDKSGGSLSVAVGGNTFKTESLSKNVDVLSQVSANGQFVILAAKHKKSQTVIALDLNDSTMRKLEGQTTLDFALMPESTSGNDLSTWDKY